MNLEASSRVEDQPLIGLRVLDFTRVLAGPFCTMILADLGAEVIKIEGPDTPDYTRTIPPFVGDVSHYFLSVNRNKKAVALDLKSVEGREIALELGTKSDVVVENFRPGVMQRLGLDYPSLRARKPDIIYCSLSGFGQRGTLAGRASVDTVVQALSGAMSVNGEAGGPAIKLGLPVGDLAGSMWAAVGVLAALHKRDSTGVGSHIDVSLLDSLVGLLSYLAQLYLVTGESPDRVGSNHQTVPAYGRYAVKDGYLVLAAQMDSFWAKFCAAAERPDLATDVRFKTVGDRREHYAEVEQLVSDLLGTKTLEEWMRLLEAADVPYAPILSVGEALEQTNIHERGLVRGVEQPGAGVVRVLGPVLKFSEDPSPSAVLSAPALGQHTRSVLRDVLGLSTTRIDALIKAGTAAEEALHGATQNRRSIP